MIHAIRQRLARSLVPDLILTEDDMIDVKLERSLKPDPNAVKRSRRSARGWVTRKARAA